MYVALDDVTPVVMPAAETIFPAASIAPKRVYAHPPVPYAEVVPDEGHWKNTAAGVHVLLPGNDTLKYVYGDEIDESIFATVAIHALSTSPPIAR